MPNIEIPIKLPAIDLAGVLPWLVLAVIGVAILATLTARSLITSRAFAVAMVAGVFVFGSSTIVGGLQALAGVVLATGAAAVAVVVALGRHPEIADLIRELSRPALPPPSKPAELGRPDRIALPSARTSAGRDEAIDLGEWGFK